MLLETIQGFVARFRNYEESVEQTQPTPSAVGGNSYNQPIQARFIDNASDRAYSSTLDPSLRPPLEGQPTSTILASGLLPNAHDMVINNSVLMSYMINSGGTVLQLLAEKRIRGAEVDSSARDPPPKCHPDTRKTLRGRIVDWVINMHRSWRMLWIMGPMGVGKSAIAQTIAEEFKEKGRLGATLFFSRPNHRDDPDGVIPTLAYQLTVRYPEYKRIVTQRLADDTTILEKNRRTQFKELIIEPFQILMTQHEQMVREPLLIILDGLDECQNKEAQCEFIELISDHVRQVKEFPLLWMVCSRPEWHLKGLLSQPDFRVHCEREEIPIDDDEAQQDVGRFLRDGFRDILHKYWDRLEPGWPPEAHVRQISVSASGHFAFASTIVKFVGDEYYANPGAQLGLCVRFLGRSGLPGAINPLHALDLLYRRILSDVPNDVLAITMRILGVIILYPNDRLTVHNQANFLCIDQPTFYRSLQCLHSVVDIPSGTDATRHQLQFYHASFADYLGNPARSGIFSIDKRLADYDVAIHSLEWQRRPVGTAEVNHDSYSALSLAWPHPKVGTEKVFKDLRRLSSDIGWRACCRVSDKDLPSLVARLEHFDFKQIANDPVGFGGFLAWLYKLGDQTKSLIRLVASLDSVNHENTEALSFVHRTDSNIEEYLLTFGRHPDEISKRFLNCDTLRFRLGKGNNVCNIDLDVVSHQNPRTHTRSKKWPMLNGVIASDSTRTRFKITNKPSQEILTSTFYTFRHCFVHATPTYYMRLFSKCFPWSIEIPTQQQDITCETVWNAIYAALQEPLEDAEWEMLCNNGGEGQKRMGEILKARKKRAEINSLADKRILRCDYLGEDIWFLGLEKDGEYEKRRLFSGSTHAQMPTSDNTWLVSMGK